MSRASRRAARARLRQTRAHLETTLVLRLRATERCRLARAGRLTLGVTATRRRRQLDAVDRPRPASDSQGRDGLVFRRLKGE